MTTNHASLTDPEIHEPKNVSTATSGQVYTADGSGSGSWQKQFKYIGVGSSYSTASPYVHTLSTTDSVLNPTVGVINSSQFTLLSSPNMRLRYDGVEALKGHCTLNFSFRQSDGADRDVQWLLVKNGVPLTGSRMIATCPSAKWVVGSLAYDVSLTTNDYLEVYASSSSGFNSDYAKLYLSIEGHVV